MCKCSVCGKNKSSFIMNNKLACMRCDELLFDIEIECDEAEITKPASTGSKRKETPATKRTGE